MGSLKAVLSRMNSAMPGCVFTPIFRICVTVCFCLFYVIQIVAQSRVFDSALASTAVESDKLLNSTEEETDVRRIEKGALTISALLLVTSTLQLASAWFDYQVFERWVLHTDAIIFGLTTSLLMFSNTTEILESNPLWKILYLINCIFAAFVAFIDILDMRPMGADRQLDLLQQYRGEITSKNRECTVSTIPSGQDFVTLHSKAIGKLRSAASAPGVNYTSVVGVEDDYQGRLQVATSPGFDTDLEKGVTSGENFLIENDSVAKVVSQPMSSTLLDSDISSGFRVKFESLNRLALSSNHQSIFSDTMPIESLSETPNIFPSDVRWDSLSYIEHRIDSSSCHIYTALWQGKPVIVKLIKANRVNNAVSLSEFEAEAAVLGNIRHPHIVKMLGSGILPRRFIILELLEGGSMSHSLGLRPDSMNRTRRQKFSYLETLTMARNLASALDYLHHHVHGEFQVIHRDLKPDNIGWTSSGTLKLFDFGLCSVVLNEDGIRTRNVSSAEYISYRKGYRMTGNTGTLRYMAPEVALNLHYNASVDVYSFSIVVWQVLTGRIPFASMNKRKYMERVVKGGQRPALPKFWPSKFRRLLTACWDGEKEKRPEFSEILPILDELIDEEKNLERTGWRWIRNTIKILLKSIKRLVVKVRPFFLVIFIVIAIASSIAVTNGNNESGIALAFFASSGMYLVLVSGLRYHIRGEGSKTKHLFDGGNDDENSLEIDADDILKLSVSLETGAFRSKKESAFSFAFNPMGPSKEDAEPLYGL